MVCPTIDEYTNQPCKTHISELDLKAIGVSKDLIEKASDFSLGKAIDKMEEFTWCPKSECGKVAEVYQ